MKQYFALFALLLSLAACPGTISYTKPVEGSESYVLGMSRLDENRPVHSEREQVLDLVIRDVLTNRTLKIARDSFGTTGDFIVGLSTASNTPWPKGYKPMVRGYRFNLLDPDQRERATCRKLGITLHHFVFPPSGEKQETGALYKHEIAIGLFNIGGHKNGQADGGCLVEYSVRRLGERWVVEYEGSMCP